MTKSDQSALSTSDPAPLNAPPAADAGETKRPKALSPAAQRALAEAQARREAQSRKTTDQPSEINGPKGLEPTRYGDWEKSGRAYDF